MENHEIDFSLALQMQAQFEEELRVSLLKQEAERSPVLVLSQGSPGPVKKKFGHRGELDEPSQEKLSVSLIDPTWEMIDPNPDIHTLFLTFNNQFFWGRLEGVEIRWSPRMTLCAGVCCYEGRGGLCSVRLSLPLLKLRPRKDLIETLLHEMIHAYLFVTANNRDRDGHGPEFHKHMYRINGVAGTKISVYHSFHDEVDVYRQHIWQCDGPCKKRRPYFGLLKRAMNRVPGPRDPWWQQHQQSCGGTYTKIQEPEGYGGKKKKTGATQDKKGSVQNNDIRKFFGGVKGEGKSLTGGPGPSGVRKDNSQRGKKVGSSPPLKENIPGYNNTKKTGQWSGNMATTDGDSSTRKASNIHGLGSTATGTVRQVNVKNANQSQVHGFGGSSPAKKKPRLGSEGGSNTTGGGPKSGNPGAGSGLAVRTGGGSKTVTVKGKVPTKTEMDQTSGNSATSVPSFHGQGCSLGGGRTGVSRLLSLSISSTNTMKNDSNPQSTKSSQVNSFEKSTKSSSEHKQNGYVKCPVCSREMLEAVINDHISDCIGEFNDDDDDWDDISASQTFIPQTKLENITKESDTISVSSDDSGDFFTSGNNVRTTSASARIPSEVPSTEDVFPCPVCNEKFSQANMNGHLDTHF